MLAPSTLQRIDQLLNELEGLAHGEMSSVQFLSLLTERLRFVTGAAGTLILFPTSSNFQSSMALAQSGHVDQATIERLLDQLRINSHCAWVTCPSSEPFVCAVALRGDRWQKGALLLTLPHKPAPEALANLSELMAAFAEVASIKQLVEVERFLDSRWQALQDTVNQITESQRLSDASTVLVNHLLPVLGAARLSLAERGLVRGLQISAVSGVSQLDGQLDCVKALRQLAQTAMQTGQPVLRHAHPITRPEPAATSGESAEHLQAASHQSNSSCPPQPASPSTAVLDADGLFQNLIALELSSRVDGRPDTGGVLVVEWSSEAAMVAALPVLTHVLPIVSNAWRQQRRWLRIPALGRRLSIWDLQLPQVVWRMLRWAIVALVCVLTYRSLIANYPLFIEAPAFLEPAIKRSIFATADGFVDALLVDDGQSVTAGQTVAKLRSPALDLQIEELQGQLRALVEKRGGLRIAINQIDTSTKDALTQQSRLSAEVAQLTTQESNIQKQLKLLGEERQKLELVAPIAGVVVARDLKQQLLRRPVRRGDSLFTVVDLQGPWHLRIEVADRDSGYVRSHLAATDALNSTDAVNAVNAVDATSNQLEFVLDSLPEKRFQANVQWVSDTVQNRPGEGCYLEIRAQVQREIVEQSHMGAGALAYFQCGQQPLWFVWCRPLVEATQRKLWFWSEAANNDVAHP
ncbi:MAG: efflux RND transporter periplasmic adaptor subunit [Pirellulaceae bacterium]|nr:efflux RND transporter periplasmic adaptor subunit [Pirellulaceae bacterium]